MSKWIEKQLKEIPISIEIGGTPSRDNSTYWVPKGSHEGVPWVSIADMKGRFITSTKERISEPGVENSNVKPVKSGTVLMSFKLSIGKVAYAKFDLVTNEAIAAFSPSSEVNNHFLYYQLPRAAKSTITDSAIKGATLNKNKLANLKISYPQSLGEQTKIAEVLTTIDELIESTEAMIAKQEKVKAGMMHDLFTRGVWTQEELDRGDHIGTPAEHTAKPGQLRPTPSQAPQLYKPSPLGPIPKVWDVLPLSKLTNTITSGARDWAQYYSSDGALFVRISNLTRKHVNFRWGSIRRVSPPNNSEGQRTSLEENDILISITADLGIIGVVRNIELPAYINQHVALVRPNQQVCPSSYIGNYLASEKGLEQFDKLNDSGAKAGLNLPTVRNLLIATPIVDSESNAIATRIDQIDISISKEQSQLNKLRQQKQGLMQDLLTGKVRVAALLQKGGENVNL